MFHRTASLALMMLAFATQSTISAAFDLTPGNVYSTEGLWSAPLRAITEYDASGNIVGALNLSAVYGDDLRGLGFGVDGMLYLTVMESDCQHFNLVQVDSYGIARGLYRGVDSCAGNSNAGQIAAAPNGDIYIANNLGLFAFNTQTRNSYTIHPAVYLSTSILGVTVLPSGNLLVANSNNIWEMMNDGSIVRSISPNTRFLYNIQSLAYDPYTNRIFVSALNSSAPDAVQLKLTALDGTSGAILYHFAVYGPGVLTLTANQTLVVASGYSPAKIFDEDLNQLGTLQNSSDEQFVSGMPQLEDMISLCNPNPEIECADPPPPVWQPPR